MLRTVSTSWPGSIASFTERDFSAEMVATRSTAWANRALSTVHDLLVVLRDHPHVVGEGAVDHLGGQRGAAELEAHLGLGRSAARPSRRRPRAGGAPPARSCAARSRPAGPTRALRRRHLGQGQAVAVGGHGAQLGLAVLDHRVEVQAVQVVARLLGGDGEAGLVDQPRSGRRRRRLMRPDRPSDDMTGKSPAGSTGRLKRERPAETDRRGSSPAQRSSTSAPSGSLRTIS